MKANRWNICIIVLLAMLFLDVNFAQADEGLEKLPADQKALAERTIKFMSDMEKKYFTRAGEMNGNNDVETKEFTTDDNDYEIKVTRGAVMEKLGQMTAIGKKASPQNRIPGNLLWGRFYSIDAHPKSPLVGMLHATVVVQFFDSGMSFAGGWVGIMPGTRIEADLSELKQSVDTIFAEYNVSPDYYRELICKGDPREIDRQWRRKPACVGVSFYGRPAFASTEKNFNLVTETFVNFVDVYMRLVDKQKNAPYTETDIEAQNNMRKQWLLDQILSDPYASKLVPFEVWSLANVPPVIKW